MLLAGGTFPGLRGWFEVGTADAGPLAALRELVPLARSAGLAAVCHKEIPS